ncbi:DUF1653 domain-containing protein [Marinomonas agarivorans]|nr:DUF1653 domain-containing protein [Marinomonas agarivorans]
MPSTKAPTLKAGVYRHYKGQHYLVDKIVQHSETDEYMVLYQMLYGDFRWWVRPLDVFLEPAMLEGQPCERFQWVSDTVTTE